MKVNFSFNTNTHDFWDIYESIKKYYPIGLEQKEGRGIYYEYRGLKELEKILVDNVHDSKKFKERWVNFTDEIGQELNKEIFGTTYGQAPSFSSSVVLERKRIENCNILKAVNFSISFVGKFFQIYGLDTISVVEDRESLGYSNVVTASPHKEYKEIFDFVEKKIRTKYPNHKFVPFGFGQTRINGLQVRYMNNNNCTINEALFNQNLSEENISKRHRGDKYYGKDDWKIK